MLNFILEIKETKIYQPPPKKLVTSEEFFGDDKVKIAVNLKKETKIKVKKDSKSAKEKKTEVEKELHDDEEFMDTLDKLNESFDMVLNNRHLSLMGISIS